jgi:hypothetical protein
MPLSLDADGLDMARPKHIRQHHAFPGDVGASLSDGAAIAGNQDSVGA